MVHTPIAIDFTKERLTRYRPGDKGFVTGTEWNLYPALWVPEVNSGFVLPRWYERTGLAELADTGSGISIHFSAAAPDFRERALPLWYKMDVGPGRYRITATLSAGEEGGEALLFVGRRRLCWRGNLKKSQSVTVTALCEVSPIIASGGGDAAVSDLGRMEGVSIDVSVTGAALTSLTAAPWEGPALYLMGDSTVTDQPAQIPYAPGAAYSGWGQMLPLYLGEQFCVSNHAHSGLSTETFRDRGHFCLLRELLKSGDTVMIQFGHNDQKRKHLSAESGFTDNLVRYIGELRAAGANPVLVTPLARNTWKSETVYNDMLTPFADAMLAVGRSWNVPVLDLHGAMKDAVCGVGLERARAWFHAGDFTHTNDFGASMAAGFVAEEMARAELAQRKSFPDWEIHGPMTEITPPSGEDSGTKPLVDYGLIPEAPWEIT